MHQPSGQPVAIRICPCGQTTSGGSGVGVGVGVGLDFGDGVGVGEGVLLALGLAAAGGVGGSLTVAWAMARTSSPTPRMMTKPSGVAKRSRNDFFSMPVLDHPATGSVTGRVPC